MPRPCLRRPAARRRCARPIARPLARKRRRTWRSASRGARASLVARRLGRGGRPGDVLSTKIGNFVSYFDRICHAGTAPRVWTDVANGSGAGAKWLRLLGETLLISLCRHARSAAIGGVRACASSPPRTLAGAGRPAFAVRRLLEFCRTVPDIVFALIFVIAFGLGPMAGVLAIAIHTVGALGKLFAEIVENIDMKPVEGVAPTGASWIESMRFAVLPQVLADFASYTLLRFEINVRGAAVMGFVGAGGIGQELVVAVRKFYYSDVSAILLMIIVTVFVIDIGTGWLRAPAVRHGGAGMTRLPADDPPSCASAIPPCSTGRLAARLAHACDRRWRCARRSCIFGLVDLDFSPARHARRDQPTRLDRHADAAARSRLVAAAPILQALGETLSIALLGTTLAAAARAAGQPAGGPQHRAVAIFVRFPVRRCLDFDPRRRHADLGAGLDQRRRARPLRRRAGDRVVGFRRVRQTVLRGDRGRRQEAGRGHRARPAAARCTRSASA